ncbi:MAG: hypothetical protein WKF75_18060, partial [Singulisphaera sp.]
MAVRGGLWAWTLALFFGAMTGGGTPTSGRDPDLRGVHGRRRRPGVAGVLDRHPVDGRRRRDLARALAVIAALSATSVMVAWMVILVAWWTATGDASFAGPGITWLPISFQACFQVVQLALYALLATLVVIECRLRFDRIAGRMAGGALEVAVDRAFHGLPTAPVMIDPTAVERAAPAVAIPADGPADLPLAGDLARREGAAGLPPKTWSSLNGNRT